MYKQLKKLLLILFLLFYSGQICVGQDAVWANKIGSKKNDECRQTIRTNHGYILPIYFHDSFYALGKWYNTKSGFYGSALYMFFYSFNGNLKKIIQPKGNDSVFISKINPEANDIITFNSNVAITPGTYIDGKHYNRDSAQWLLELDTQGVYHRIMEISCKYRNQTVFANITVGACQWINNHYYISLRLGGPGYTYYFGNDSIIINSQFSILGIVLDENKKVLNKYQINTLSFPTPFVKSGNEMLLPFEFQNPDDTIVWNNVKYPYKKDSSVVIFTLDTLLNFKQIKRYYGHNLYFAYSPFGGVLDQKFYYSSNLFTENNRDTIIWQNTPHTLYYGYNPIISYISNSRSKFQKLVTKQFGNSTGTSSSLMNLSVTTKNEFAYISGQSAWPTIIYPDSLLINSKVQDPDFFLMKLDTFGNILWYLNFGKKGSSEYANPVIIEDDGVVVSGTFDSTTTLGNYTLTSNGGTDALLFKISDNSIYRGNIYKGPYCAGDSIEVPYRAYGKYADTNTFFAELSDENGNFYGTPRQLGSLKTNVLQGTIRGVLPLFDVVSSGNYRIRIRSNSPFVQSFMRYDSLKLRIYSKDKALPGPDTTVCFGVPVQLSAKGGSLWKWTPGAVLNDSTSRTPLFIAKKTTKFRIAISDSSGCGMPDTAFKTVYVLPAPVVVAKDTIVCRGDEFYLNATTFGGKTDSMHTFWYLDTVFLGRDTVKVKTYANARYTVIAKDGCSQANDTASLVAKLPLAPIILTEDTAVCKGLPFKWSGSGLGYKNRKLKFTWYKNNQLFATDSLFVTPDSSSTFTLQADDACATEIAAKIVTLHVLPDPKLLAQTDSICAHNNHSINFYPTLGRAPYEFYLEGKQVFNGLKIKGDSFKNVVFEVMDACKRKAFDTLELGKIPEISITAEPNQGCIPLQTKLKAVPTKFDNYWIFPNSQKVIGNTDPIIVEHKTTGNFKYKYVVKNGICADSSDLIISVYPSPTAAFQINGKNLLIGEANTRIVNYSTGANRFVWNWLNQQRYDSTITSFQLQFSDTGKFEISLIAENNYGCKDTANDFIFVHPKPIIWIPNGISLNGDGLNEKLEPGGIGIKDYNLMVINKWGEIIFNGKENEPWYPKSETLPGVYVYRCVYSNWKGLKFEENGTVLLIK